VARNVGKPRARGSVEELPSGGYRVRVYAGVDPMTGRDRYLPLIDTRGTRRVASHDVTTASASSSPALTSTMQSGFADCASRFAAAAQSTGWYRAMSATNSGIRAGAIITDERKVGGVWNWETPSAFC
jgi:hypothetical protein